MSQGLLFDSDPEDGRRELRRVIRGVQMHDDDQSHLGDDEDEFYDPIEDFFGFGTNQEY